MGNCLTYWSCRKASQTSSQKSRFERLLPDHLAFFLTLELLMLRVKCSMVVMLTPQSSMECFFDWTKKRLLIKSQAASTLGLFWAQNFKIGRCEILQKKSQLNYFDWPIQLDFKSNCHNFPKFYSQNYRISCHKIPTFWDLLDFLFRCEPYAWQLFNRSFFRKLVRTLIQNNILKRNLLHTSHITCQTVASFSSPLCSTSGIPFWPDFSYYLVLWINHQFEFLSPPPFRSSIIILL